MSRAAARDYRQHRSQEQEAADEAAAAALAGGGGGLNAGLRLEEFHRNLKQRWERHVEPLVAQVGSRLRRGERSSGGPRRLRRTPSTVQLPEEVDMRATQIHEAVNMSEELAREEQQHEGSAAQSEQQQQRFVA